METNPNTAPLKPRIVGPAGTQRTPSVPSVSRRGSRLDRYRDRYSDLRSSGGAVLVSGKQPVPVFLTLKFWRGFILVGMLNIAIFWSMGNVNMSWLIHPAPMNGKAGAAKFAWPKGMVPLQIERTSTGELIVTVPTRTLTPEEQETLKKLWDTERNEGVSVSVKR